MGGQFNPPRPILPLWDFKNYYVNIIISLVFPEHFIEIPQVFQKT